MMGIIFVLIVDFLLLVGGGIKNVNAFFVRGDDHF